MLNFLYCFDNNYIKQACTSMYSILNNSESKINIFVINKSAEGNNFIPKKILHHKNLNKINIYEFDKKIKFPNLYDVHVSEATYYRLFIHEYIDTKINSLIYVDSDIVCINKFENVLSKEIERLLESKKIVSAKTEFQANHKEGLGRFGIKDRNYFNAGVLIIDYQQWLKEKVGEKLIYNLSSNKEDLKYWDQDLLNIYFEGNFIELDNYLNFKVYLNENNFKYTFSHEEEDRAMFLHYSGKFKPWSLKGALNKNSKFYHSKYKKLYDNDYHIYNARRFNTFKDLIKNIFNLRIFTARKFLTLLMYTFLSFRKNNRSL